MPWKEFRVSDARLDFIGEWRRGEWSFAELCRRHGVSRPTGYKWVERFGVEGAGGLRDRDRAPLEHPNETPRALVERLCAAREAHPTWGPRKLLAWLGARHPALRLPSASTVGAILRREGLVSSRRRRRRAPAQARGLRVPEAPGQVWSADFKGWFRARNGERIDPLTVSDGATRYLLVCEALERADWVHVRRALERSFREHGLPEAIRTDNGAPFASTALGGLSRLSVWWIKLGVVPDRIRAGHPEDNGRHERMHRTLKAETARPPRATRRAQQRAFDAWRREYNEERPHEALGQRPPASVYAPSPRPYPSRVREWVYDEGTEVRRVRSNGEIKWRGGLRFVSMVLVGERVGLEPVGDGIWTLRFGPVELARWDDRRGLVPR